VKIYFLLLIFATTLFANSSDTKLILDMMKENNKNLIEIIKANNEKLQNEMKANYKRLEEQIKTSNKRLEEQIKAVRVNLENQIKATKTDLENQIKATKTDLENQIKATKTDLENQIKATKTDLGNQIKATNKRIDDVNSRIDTLSGYILALFSGLMAFVGFIYWDRRTMISKAKQEAKDELRESFVTRGMFNEIVDILKDLANIDEKVANVMSKHNLRNI